MMFQSKVKNQKLELLRAALRNVYLREKQDYLNNECKLLAERILISQVTAADSNEIGELIQEKLKKIREDYDQKLSQLQRANENVFSLSMILEDTESSMLQSLSESKNIKETLLLKDEMIKCLQEELISVRLKQAEKQVTINELKKSKTESKIELDLLNQKKPKTIARLQSELINAKYIELQYSKEFSNIKNILAKIKSEYEETSANPKKENDSAITLTKNGVLWFNKNKVRKTKYAENIKQLEEEQTNLKNVLPELENKIEKLNIHSNLKDEYKKKLEEKTYQTIFKIKSTEKLTQERQRQYNNLKSSGTANVNALLKSCEEKNEQIRFLTEKLDKLSTNEASPTAYNTIEAQVIEDLETTVSALENKILILHGEIKTLKTV